MRFARIQLDHDSTYAIVEDDGVKPIEGTPFEPYSVASGSIPLSDVTLLAPVEPSKIVAVGLNYIDHARELGMELPEEPILFLKPSTSVIGTGAAIHYPSTSGQVDYEAELAVVIGRRTYNISPEEAGEYVLGYTCANDVTARDLQKKDGQWTRAKSFDTFTPLGPWIETELDPSDVRIEAYLNGELKQSSTTANLIFDVPFIVSFASKVMTLLPGDVIITGTPVGVGPMKPGDEIEVRIEGIGSLINRVVDKATA